MKSILLLALAGLTLLALTGCATTDQAKADVKPYPFDTCAVINKPLGERPRRRVLDGQEVLFCCDPCVKAFEAYPEPYMARIRAHYAGQETPHVKGADEAVVQAAIEMGEEVGP